MLEESMKQPPTLPERSKHHPTYRFGSLGLEFRPGGVFDVTQFTLWPNPFPRKIRTKTLKRPSEIRFTVIGQVS
jgi:hypothetical protein